LGAEELRDLLGRAAIFAEPARYEPFGLAALEAGLSGCALVLGDLASLREVWADAAIYVDPFDDEQLRRALQTLAQQSEQREQLGRSARRRALSYSRERMTSAYLDLYEQLITEAEQARTTVETV
jgi:glycosyltransferase involved in cell wall biosynthesis